ncbi:MAG: transcriptional coactivator p15/PC4 family protein [Nitrososphaerota archaeon]|nr:transcriptional coactivator p15/PC4 family protein [Nitrososphaerota archaeon]MDG6940126.1 transcriptional coactivator p15/PC4 family protein [Nitrososphaerota archaeon]
MSEEEFKSTPVAEVVINESTTIKVATFVDRKGGTRVDVRAWISTASYTGPTKKGVTFPVERLDEVLAALQKARQ